MTKPSDDERFNRTLKRMLSTPPKPHDEMKKGRPLGKRASKPEQVAPKKEE